jgi:HAMP domain-containing protein
MELLLNLLWVLLVLPGYWLWRRNAVAKIERRFSSWQCLLALGCLLVLLFPVISATDDLHAMRTEMEEPGQCKRTVRQAATEKNSAWVNRLQSPPAAVASAMWLPAPEAERHETFVVGSAPQAAPCISRGGRAPPLFLLG